MAVLSVHARRCGRRWRDLDEVLVIALVSKTVMPVRVPTGQVFSHTLGVFATDSYCDQAVLSSSAAPDLGDQVRLDACGHGPAYTPSDVFETFPRPAPTRVGLRRVGRTARRGAAGDHAAP